MVHSGVGEEVEWGTRFLFLRDSSSYDLLCRGGGPLLRQAGGPRSCILEKGVRTRGSPPWTRTLLAVVDVNYRTVLLS